MPKRLSWLFLVATGFLYFLIPYFFSRIRWKGTTFPDTPPGLPPGYGLFTDQQIIPPPPPNWDMFWAFAAIGAVIVAFLLFPRLFGFQKPTPQPAPPAPKGAFPWYFWPAFICMVVSWFMLWSRWPAPFFQFAFVPLWWGFIFSVDAWVYKRNNGVSIYTKNPQVFKIIFAFSSVAWFSFEYLNFFVVEIWYYPNNGIFTNFGFIFWYLLSFTVVWPGIFEWYTLLRTFNWLGARYEQGPQWSLSRPWIWALYFLGLAAFALMALFPRPCFMLIWLAPILILGAALALTGHWTPFRPIKKGCWTPCVLMALAALVNGFFYEMWNEGSEWIHYSASTNPNYWKYAVPYLDMVYIFSQMPLLGYLGYLGFGLICWCVWLYGASVVGFPSEFDDTQQIR